MGQFAGPVPKPNKENLQSLSPSNSNSEFWMFRSLEVWKFGWMEVLFGRVERVDRVEWFSLVFKIGLWYLT